MPEMDGFTLTRRIKATAGMQAIPVIIHSSLSGSANEEHVRKVGANAYVSKFAASELATVMRDALKRPAPERPAFALAERPRTQKPGELSFTGRLCLLRAWRGHANTRTAAVRVEALLRLVLLADY